MQKPENTKWFTGYPCGTKGSLPFFLPWVFKSRIMGRLNDYEGNSEQQVNRCSAGPAEVVIHSWVLVHEPGWSSAHENAALCPLRSNGEGKQKTPSSTVPFKSLKFCPTGACHHAQQAHAIYGLHFQSANFSNKNKSSIPSCPGKILPIPRNFPPCARGSTFH